jgi:regulator of protease activity HflC (stomatin/prohibitin superfamily)
VNPITLFLVVALFVLGLAAGEAVNVFLGAAFIIAAVVVALSLKMANVWQKFVVLRAGKLQGVRGPGLFWIFPCWTAWWPSSTSASRPPPSTPSRP